MGYCRYCGVEISFKRTKNNKWLPCNFLTGEIHFCNDSKNTTKVDNGLKICMYCGKPVFLNIKGKIKMYVDYTTLKKHLCQKADVTRYTKYKEKKSKLM